MKGLLLGVLVFYFTSMALAEDAVCDVENPTDLTVVISDGDSFKYKTSSAKKYGKNMNCKVNYELDQSCAEMELRCKKIVIKGNKDCSKGDKLMITNDDGTETVCGKKKKFVFKSSSNMVLEFTSDKKKSGPGAKGCVVQCTQAATVTTAPAPAPVTTAPAPAPVTTAPAPATTASPAPTTTAVPGTGSPLDNLNINPDTIAISGFSSGGSFSTQFHVAFSKKISAVGVFAGDVYLATTGMNQYGDLFWEEIAQMEQNGHIDPVENMKNDKIYIYHGKADSIVPYGDTLVEVEDFYKHYVDSGNSIATKFIDGAEHGFPTTNQGGPCEALNSPNYISNCNYDGAYGVLSKALGSIEPKDEGDVDYVLKVFDQEAFFPEGGTFMDTGMDVIGYVFVPDNCVNGTVQCHLHVHLHGCAQGRELIGESYARGTGFLPLAMKNNVVMVFPQARQTANNFAGCWNNMNYLPFWDNSWEYYQFASKEGRQMKIMARIIEKAAQISMF